MSSWPHVHSKLYQVEFEACDFINTIDWTKQEASDFIYTLWDTRQNVRHFNHNLYSTMRGPSIQPHRI